MTEISDTIKDELIKMGTSKANRLDIKNKGWITKTLKEERNHEMRMEMIRWLAKDEESKYYLGMVLGSATATAGAIMTGALSVSDIQGVLPSIIKKGSGTIPTDGAGNPAWQPGNFVQPNLYNKMQESGVDVSSFHAMVKNGKTGYVSCPEGWYYLSEDVPGPHEEGEVYNGYPAAKAAYDDFKDDIGLETPMLGWDARIKSELQDDSLTWVRLMGNLMMVGGTGFSGACFLLLMTKFMFGRQTPFEQADSLIPL